MTNLPEPPKYVKLPVAIASADVPDGLIVTMARILSLCWAQGYRESPAYAPEELAERLGRPRTTVYRHLKELQRLQWLEVRHHERRLVLEPLVWASIRPRAGGPSPEGRGCDQPPQPEAPGEPGLRAALDEVGITGQVLHELVQKNVDPVQVRAWYLWTWAPDQGWVTNPAGYIVNRLRHGEEAPEQYAELALLTAEEQDRIRYAWVYSEQYQGWPSLHDSDKLFEIAPLWVQIHEAMRRAQAR